MNRKTMIRTKPLFPIEYGFAIRDIRGAFTEMSDRGTRVTQKDVIKIHNLLSFLEGFIRFIIHENPEIEYSKKREDIMRRFGRQRNLYGQLICLKEWFGLLNLAVGKMYFDVAGVERYDFDFGTHRSED